MAYKRPAPVDLCEHRILRENCDFCPAAPVTKTPEEIKQMFAVRNAIVGAMDAIVAYNWIDPKDETKLNGASMGLMLLKLSKRSWAPVSKVFELSRNLAAAANVSRGYIERLQRAAVETGILEDTGERSKLGAPVYIINVEVINEFKKKDELTHEVEQSFRAGMRKPIDPEDAAEEAAQFADEEDADYDNVEDAPFEPARINEDDELKPGTTNPELKWGVINPVWDEGDDSSMYMPKDLMPELTKHLPSENPPLSP